MNRGRLTHRALPSGSRQPDWEGYVDVDGVRLQLIGWSQPDGSIKLVQQGRERMLSNIDMYRGKPKYG